LVMPIKNKETETVAKAIYEKWFWNFCSNAHRWRQRLLSTNYEMNFFFVLMCKTQKVSSSTSDKCLRLQQNSQTIPHIICWLLYLASFTNLCRLMFNVM
jgi:hypothetical protein